MMITDLVSHAWLSMYGMTRFNQIGIPVDLSDLNKGLRWKNISDLTENDFDILDSYFEMKNRIQK